MSPHVRSILEPVLTLTYERAIHHGRERTRHMRRDAEERGRALGRGRDEQRRIGQPRVERLPREHVEHRGAEPVDVRATIDIAHTPERLLWRLFSEEAPDLQAPRLLAAGCRCSRARIEPVLASLSEDELAEMTVEGRIAVTCQFCNRVYDFTPADVAALKARAR